jgi:uncharacterized C2H2 Zn-finger protein
MKLKDVDQKYNTLLKKVDQILERRPDVPKGWFIFRCPRCDVEMGVTTEFSKRRQEDHRWLYCPNGDMMRYPLEKKK